MGSGTVIATHYYFNENFNCAQSVIAAFSEKYGVDKISAMKLAGGLGSGFRCGEICGAVSGAVMVIGLKYGQTQANDKETKEHCYKKTEDFTDKFKEENGSILCRDLLGYDVRRDREFIKQSKELKLKCTALVEAAADLLERMGY